MPPEAVWDGVIQANSQWCYVDEDDCKNKLKMFHKGYSNAVGKAKKLQAYIKTEFAPDKKHAEFVEQILLSAPEAKAATVPTSDVMVFDWWKILFF